MSKRPKKSRTEPPRTQGEMLGVSSGLPRPYRRARQLVERGQFESARRIYEKLAASGVPLLQSLVANDLGVLAAMTGNYEEACQYWEKALAVDENCSAARLNLSLLRAELGEARAVSGTADFDAVTTPATTTGVIKVAILSFLFNWPSTGGGIVHTVELARLLAQAGYEVRHYYAHYPAWGVGRVETSPPFCSEALEFDESSWELSEIQRRFRQAIDRFGPDHVIITDSWNIKPLLAEAVRGYSYILRFQAMECLCPLNNVRLLPGEEGGFRQCHLHQLASPDECVRCLQRHGRFSGELHRAERSLSGFGTPDYHSRLVRAMHEATAVLVVNPLMEAMLGPYNSCVRVVTAGIDPARFPWPRADEEREPPGGRVKTILFAGLIEEPMKGFAVLHEACAMLRRQRSDFELIATGDPVGRADEFTRLVGWQSQEDLPDHIFASDIVVIPTIAQEALGRTAVEAMAAGRPVVASRIGGLQFTVADGATGLLCTPGDAEDLARKLAILLDDAELRDRMGRAGRQRFEEHYSWDVIIERHYRPLLKPRSRATSGHQDYAPSIPDRVDRRKLVDDLAGFLGLPRDRVEEAMKSYHAFHEAKGYSQSLGELKTLCFEEAFILCQFLSLVRPRTIVEVGTQHGKSTRRILDMVKWLGLDSRVVCFDTVRDARHFGPAEAELIVRDVTGRFREEILERYDPGLIYLDVHPYGLLKEAIVTTMASHGSHVLAIHDCGRGLCNPRMALAKDDPAVTSLTGVWERHVLAEIFSVSDPMSSDLDVMESTSHRLRIFDTLHGLGVVLPRSMKSGA